MVGAPCEPGPLVTVDWLKDHLDAPDVKIVDATWVAPFIDPDTTGQMVFDAGHIPGAVFFDIDRICDRSSFLPHMMPTPEQFASDVSALGLGDGCQVVVYDQNGYMAAARAWWMFRAMGHEDVVVLDGGAKAWTQAGGAMTDETPRLSSTRVFTPQPNADLTRLIGDMRAHVSANDAIVLDARPPGRFDGTAPEPREGLTSGHMPGATNLPHGQFIHDDGRFRSASEIQNILNNVGLEADRPIVTTCGSGVTAAIVALGLAVAGHKNAAVYDGSWSEWGGASDCPVVTGAAQA